MYENTIHGRLQYQYLNKIKVYPMKKKVLLNLFYV
jgi:hypothetical protein